MLSSVKTLIQQTDLIKENASDPEMLAALYHKISLGFAPSPKLRLTWMNNLTQLHVKNDNLTEAAQCKMVFFVHHSSFEAYTSMTRTP